MLIIPDYTTDIILLVPKSKISMEWRDSNVPEEYRKLRDKQLKQRINIIVENKHLVGDDFFKDLFSPGVVESESTTEIYELKNKPLFDGNESFNLYWVKQGYQVDRDDKGIKINTAVLILDLCHETKESFFSKIYSFVNLDAISFDLKIPLCVLCIRSDGIENFPDINDYDPKILNTTTLLENSNRFIHFLFGLNSSDSYLKALRRIASIGITLSSKFNLKYLDKTSYEFAAKTVLKQRYQSDCGLEEQKNIAHLIAKTDVAWAVNKLANDFPSSCIFELLSEKDQCIKCTPLDSQSLQQNQQCHCSHQNPLMVAAKHTKQAVLAAFMNFYSSNIDMTEIHQNKNENEECTNKDDIKQDCDHNCNVCKIKHLLHDTDSRGKNLTYYIVTDNQKCLGAYGTILQFEQDFHIRKMENSVCTHKDNALVINQTSFFFGSQENYSLARLADTRESIYPTTEQGEKLKETKESSNRNEVTKFNWKNINKGVPANDCSKCEKASNENDKEGKEKRDYLSLHACVQNHVGTSLNSNLVLKIMESSRQPRKMSILVSVAYAILAMYLFQLGLYVLDVITDALVSNDYYQQWRESNFTDEICPLLANDGKFLGNYSLTEYPSCLSSKSKFFYTASFMILPPIFYLIEILRHYKKILKMDKVPGLVFFLVGIVIFPLLTPFWPFILFAWKTYPLVRYHFSRGPARRKYLEQFADVSLIILVVHMIEICVESSFMAILQWYTVMPTLLADVQGYFARSDIPSEEAAISISLSKASFAFSIISLAWGFTSYSAEQKDGALDFTWNPFARILLFLSNLLLIFSRINSLVLFMYYWGPGEFYPGMIWLFLHVVLMMGVHCYTFWYRNQEEKFIIDNEKNRWNIRLDVIYYMKLFYVCLLNGLANIFINNFINVSFDRFKHIGAKKRKTFYRQACGDLLFFIQNVVMMSLGLTIDVKPLNDPGMAAYLIVGICSCHLTGLLMKIVYYKYFHIWKELTVRFTSHGIKRGLDESHLQWDKKRRQEVKK